MRIDRTFLLLLCLAWMPAGRAEGMSEQEITAAYVLNFVKFAEWPAAALMEEGQHIALCVVGSEALSEKLGALDGRAVGKQVLRVIKRADADDGLKKCQVVYLDDSMRQRATAVIAALGEAPVLTISSIEGFAQRGGCIGLFSQDDKMRFEVNLAAVRKGRLRLPAQVLNLAANVFGR
jgi:hypothetical protein